ncbi:helix-turn-helix domain-containing protein [Paracoccus binzhouensis]|uniref:hypothetical protein n=1 Tax=Paracoccus binzhouensis TaxID=2796149 RepID=UPI0018EEDFF4|nr:hypothetical protein [Paracoccus binzhouensis]
MLDLTVSCNWAPHDCSVGVMIGKIRRKIGGVGPEPCRIRIIRGAGCMFLLEPRSGAVPGRRQGRSSTARALPPSALSMRKSPPRPTWCRVIRARSRVASRALISRFTRAVPR